MLAVRGPPDGLCARLPGHSDPEADILARRHKKDSGMAIIQLVSGTVWKPALASARILPSKRRSNLRGGIAAVPWQGPILQSLSGLKT